MSSANQKPDPRRATFVVVANRLPVDRVENPDGSVDWRPSPGGLVATAAALPEPDPDAPPIAYAGPDQLPI